MAISKIGIDFDSLNSIQPPDLNVSNSSFEILGQIPVKANEMANGYLGHTILFPMFMSLFLTLTDKTPFGDFGYDNLSAVGICATICAIFGLVLLNINFINSLVIVSTFIFLLMITMLVQTFTEASI